MMQFTQTQTLPNYNSPLNKNTQPSPFPFRASPWPGFPTPSFGDTTCMEQLLIHCAIAIENNDATLAQQILWVLNNIAPPDGDSSQRLTAGFLRALISRAANCKLLKDPSINMMNINNHKFSIIELATFVDLTPWHRFGFTAANAAVLHAVHGYDIIHIVDFSLTHCMQIPTLIDSIATRLVVDAPSPLVKLTVAGPLEDFPPLLRLSYEEELGSKLINFARSRNVVLEFRVVTSNSSDGFSSLIQELKLQHLVRAQNEALVINCHMMLHYIPEETLNDTPNSNSSLRNTFLKELRTLNPTIVVLVDEDADFTSNNLVNRLKSAYNYLWIPYDTMDTFLPRGSNQRQWYEADICWKIENVISHEGAGRVERLEPKSKWSQRMRNSGFRGMAFSEDAIAEVKNMLDEHAAGWGLKKEEDDLVLTWKGHNVVFATSWLPI